MATGGTSFKMGVSGVDKFRGEINKVKQSIKTVDEALKLNEKEFKANGDSQAYMQTKTELLNVKMEEQKTVLRNAEQALEQMTKKGVDKSSAAFQDMQRQVLKAKGDLLETETQLNNVGTAGDDAADGVDEMNASLKEIGKGVSYENVTSAIGSITSGLEKAFKKAVELGKAITKEVLGAGSWADDLVARATYYGLKSEDLQRMEKTAALIDTPVEAIINAQKRLKKTVAGGSDDTADTFKALGINPAAAKDAEDLFWKTGKAIMALGDEYKQEEYAQKLLGRSWNELIPLFEAGREEYEKLNDSWSVVPQENIDKLAEMDDKYQTLNNELETVKMMFLSELAPAITGVMKTITGLLEKFNEYLKSEDGQKMMESLSKAVESLFSELTNIDPEAVIKNVTSIIDKIQEGLQWIVDNKETVIGGLKGIFAGWAALKLTGGALTALKLIDGLKNLGFLGGTGGGGGTGTLTGIGGGSGGGGGLIGAVSSFFGSGAFIPFATVAAAAVPAMLAQDADERRLEEKRAVNLEAAEKLKGTEAEWWLTRAAEERSMARKEDGSFDTDFMGRHYINEGENVLDMLLGMQNRSDLQKMQLHNMIGQDAWNKLQQVWETGGYGMDAFEVTELFDTVTDAYAKMAEQSGDVTGASEAQTKSNDKMTTAAEKLTTTVSNLPRWLGDTMKGMVVQMDGEKVGRLVSDYVDEALAENLV